MPVALVNGRVLGEDRLVEGRCVLLEQGRILDVGDESDPRFPTAQRHDLGGHLLLPGVIASQANGSGLGLLTSLEGGRTLVTLAPEMTTPEIIEKLVKAGVVVSAGHTNATYAEITTALRHGLTGFTHLFNAMSQLTGREPGVVGAALDDPNSWCGIIVDGEHTSPVVLRIALRCKPWNRFMLVTDAMPSVGTDNKSFHLQGREITVSGSVCFDEDGRLAGSNIDMASCVRNAITMLGLPLPEAVR